MLLLLLLLADSPTGVICIAPLPPSELMGSAGKGGATSDYEDTGEARKKRIELAKQRKPMVYSVGEVTSARVTEHRAACIDKVPFDTKLVIKGTAPLISFRMKADAPVMRLWDNAFYGNMVLDPIAPRLYCPKRSPAPDCSWCPCRAYEYVPPPAKSQ